MNSQRTTDRDKRIVVIDDDVLLLELVERRLRGVACELTYFDDELAGLSHLRQHTPNVLIIDQRMPRLNGLDLLAELGRPAADQVFLASSAPIPSDLRGAAQLSGALPLSKDKMVEKGYLVNILGLNK